MMMVVPGDTLGVNQCLLRSSRVLARKADGFIELAHVMAAMNGVVDAPLFDAQPAKHGVVAARAQAERTMRHSESTLFNSSASASSRAANAGPSWGTNSLGRSGRVVETPSDMEAKKQTWTLISHCRMRVWWLATGRS